MNINWYPGHMAKTRRLLTENIKICDVIIELLDARVPQSSQNPEFNHIFNSKKRVKAFNKYDLADKKVSDMWKNYYSEQNIQCIFINSQKGTGFKKLLDVIEIELKEKFERDRKRGILRRPIRAMVVGIPNVGKSTFINKLTGRAATRTGDRPGVTKNKQWIKIDKKIHLLDTPGILWPKFENQKTALNLALTGAIKDEVIDIQELTNELLVFLSCNYREQLERRYNIVCGDKTGYELLNDIAKNRGYLKEKGVLDTFKTSQIILDEFRGSVIANVSLEKPPS